ncbi:hypothetical protein GCM10007972_00490 [Iodidimonas muriae]|uniref:2OG-Fe(II) oxygenase n=1 Tax=Iodidimonas muriae TaxID=261467 RepID=A0ABQ2L5L7_9PROT|nr:TIGR02466 family protein [Iodidimonas muriae]GER06312.1 hypothetical protein JCM17843_06220 [Kordiimonadales bacterium JCM 17843]GGO04258.1 hypothetical protein GCM10007972_00490 [Iodidimonas muriae]
MTQPQKPKGEVRPIFPAGAVVRYENPDHKDVRIDDLHFEQNYGSTTQSTSQDRNILKEDRFKALGKHLESCVKDYLDNVYCYDYEKFAIVHAWVNRAPEGGFQRMHFHGNSVVSGVYYLKADRKQSAPLMFEKPEINTSPYLAITTKQQTIFTANRIAYPSETGLCYLFPSQIRHGYETPTQGGERISLAFNVMLSGVGSFYRI